MRRFFLAPKTYVKIDGQENIYNFTLKIFVYLNMCGYFKNLNKVKHTSKLNPSLLAIVSRIFDETVLDIM